MKLFKKNRKPATEWYAEFRMMDGDTGICYTPEDCQQIEDMALASHDEHCFFRVNGSEWFDLFAE